LRVSSATVINVLKKKEPAVKQVNERLLRTLAPPQVNIILRQVEQAEMDEMWSFVGSKSQQRWLWHASPPYNSFRLNGDMKLHRNRQLFV
jgi:hypothetical protein